MRDEWVFFCLLTFPFFFKARLKEGKRIYSWKVILNVKINVENEIENED